MTLAAKAGLNIPKTVLESALLTEYAVEARYPGVSEDVSEEEYRQALALAETVVSWAESCLGP